MSYCSWLLVPLVGRTSMVSSKLMLFRWLKYIEMLFAWMAATKRRPDSPLSGATFMSVICFGGKEMQSSYLLVSTFHNRIFSLDAAKTRSAFYSIKLMCLISDVSLLVYEIC